MKRKQFQLRMDIDILEYTRHFARTYGLTPSEFIRTTMGNKIDELKHSMTSQEISLVERNIIQAAKDNDLLKCLKEAMSNLEG